MPDENFPEKFDEKELEKLGKKLTEEDPNLFQGLNKGKRQQILKTFYSFKRVHSGPLPHPDILEGYSQLIPNGAERIMAMAEKQQDHRIGMERRVIKNQIAQSYVGQSMAFIIGMFALGCSAYGVVTGHGWPASILGVTGVTGLVTAFIQGRRKQDKNLEDKRPTTEK